MLFDLGQSNNQNPFCLPSFLLFLQPDLIDCSVDTLIGKEFGWMVAGWLAMLMLHCIETLCTAHIRSVICGETRALVTFVCIVQFMNELSE